MTRPRRPGLLVLGGELLAAGLLVSGCSTAATTAAAATPGPATTPGPAATPAPVALAYHGEEPTGAVPRPDFALTDTAGQRFDFRARTAGRPTLLFFGYTNCPDECPTAMADITAALRSASPALRAQTQVVFVTTDPARDDARRLRRWLDRYDAGYVALRGTPAELAAAQRAVGVPVARKAGPVPTLPGRPAEHRHAPGTAPHTHDSALGYGVDHSSAIFAYDASDRLPVVYPPGSSPADLAADLPLLARKENP